MEIREVERLVGVSVATIRFWEGRGLLHIDRADNSYREYNELDVTLIRRIKEFRETGIAIADIKLWCDGIIDSNTLLCGHIKKLGENDRENKRILERCNSMLAGIEIETDASEPFSESEKNPTGRLLLGVDIGTTSISAQLISLESGEPIHTYNIEHSATVKLENFPDAFAVDAKKLCELTLGLISSAVGTYSDIASIGVTGQMHGIVCLDADGNILSPLYTWQNQFGLCKIGSETICEKIERLCGKTYPTGYGFITLFALRELGLLPENTAKLACIADLAVMRLCGLKSPIMHPTHAASLGFFDIRENRFDSASLAALGIPETVLPEVSGDFAVCGSFSGIPTATAIGDNQAGVFGSIRDDELLVNVGTSGQVSFVGDYPDKLPEGGSYELRPYFDGRYLHVGSVLCGGRALAVLADLIGEIASGLGLSVTKRDIYALINSSAAESRGLLEISTAFLGTRRDASLRGSISGIGVYSFTLAELSGGFCRGIVGELYELYREMCAYAPELCKSPQIVVSGNAMRRSPALRGCAGELFKAEPLILQHTEEAAYGAALFAAVSAQLISHEKARGLINFVNERTFSSENDKKS